MRPHVLARWVVPAFAAVAALVLGGAACSTQKTPDPTLTVAAGDPAHPIDHPKLPPAEAKVTSSKAQRLTVAQLRGSFPTALGKDAMGRDVTWRLDSGALGLDAMARPMGEPDYVSTTEEVLEPSPLYLKFSDDAARSVCDQAIKADATRAGDRVLTRFAGKNDSLASNATAVKANLRYLKLRLHGVKITADDDPRMAPLITLFDQAVQGAADKKPVAEEHLAEGWRAVCVALVIAPEFHTY